MANYNANLADEEVEYITSYDLAKKWGRSEISVKRLIREFDIPYLTSRGKKLPFIVRDKDGQKTGEVTDKKFSPYYLPLNAEKLLIEKMMAPASIQRARATRRKLAKHTATPRKKAETKKETKKK